MSKDDSTYSTMTQAHAILGQALHKMNGIAIAPEEEARLRSIHMDISAAHELSGMALGPYRIHGRAWIVGITAWLLALYGAYALIAKVVRRAQGD